jgi:hypothetical protein
VFSQQGAGESASAQKLPPDIFPESLSRMPRVKRDDFSTEEEKEAFDRVLASYPQFKNSPSALGPTGTRMENPVLAEKYRDLFNTLHEKSGLEPKYFELAVLVATRETNNEHEWNDHEPVAAKLMPQRIIELVRNKQAATGLEDKQETIIRFGRELFRQPKLSSKTFADAEKLFGRRGTLGLTLTLSYYAMNATILRAYDQHIDIATHTRPFPDLVARDAAKP